MPRVEEVLFTLVKEFRMGAKNDLNQIYINGSLFIAAMIGVSSGSWGAFVVSALVLIGTGIVTSKIR